MLREAGREAARSRDQHPRLLAARQSGRRQLKTDYELGARRPRPIVPVVVKAEIKSLAIQFEWGSAKQRALDELLRELPIADVSSEAVIDAYARLDNESRKLGHRMGKNDLWIAALTAVQNAVIVTTDQDFDHLNQRFVAVERIVIATLGIAG